MKQNNTKKQASNHPCGSTDRVNKDTHKDTSIQDRRAFGTFVVDLPDTRHMKPQPTIVAVANTKIWVEMVSFALCSRDQLLTLGAEFTSIANTASKAPFVERSFAVLAFLGHSATVSFGFTTLLTTFCS